MSLIFADGILMQAVRNNDTEKVVSILEPRVDACRATNEEALLCGILLLMPPFADYEKSKIIFLRLFDSPRGFEAAVWDAYRHAILMPDGDCFFEKILLGRANSAIALHMLSMNEYAIGNYSSALEMNRDSRTIRPFPFNLSEALKQDKELDKESRLLYWMMISDLVINRESEKDNEVYSLEGMIQHRWENLILGTRMTSELWADYREKFGP